MSILNLIPPQYKILSIGIATLIVIGLLFGSGYKVGYGFAENHYVAIISKMEKETAELRANQAELQSKLTSEIANIKEKIVTKYVDRVKVIKEKEYVYVEQAKNNVPSQYFLSNGWLSLHNSAAGNTDADTTSSSDGSASDVRDNQALETITTNYSTYYRTAEQLTALQEYFVATQAAVEKANEFIREQNKKHHARNN